MFLPKVKAPFVLGFTISRLLSFLLNPPTIDLCDKQSSIHVGEIPNDEDRGER